jgi:hypothetical protein
LRAFAADPQRSATIHLYRGNLVYSLVFVWVRPNFQILRLTTLGPLLISTALAQTLLPHVSFLDVSIQHANRKQEAWSEEAHATG